jgi:small subunit ribosomal protein S6e
MVSFKLCIANTKDGKCVQKEVKDAEAQPFIGLNIGEKISGDGFGMPGYEFLITGGSDYCGFPMRHGIMGLRKKIYSFGGVGFPGLKKGEKTRKTVCGHKIHEKITQINLKITKEGAKKLGEDAKESKSKEEHKADKKDAAEAGKQTKGEKAQKKEAPGEK